MTHCLAIIAKIQNALTRIELIEISQSDSKPILLKQELFKSQDYPCFNSCLQDFLSEFQDSPTWPKIALISVPGVPYENNSILTESHWPEISGSMISNIFTIPTVKLINSSVCASLQVLETSKEELITI
jgi:glucokinase